MKLCFARVPAGVLYLDADDPYGSPARPPTRPARSERPGPVIPFRFADTPFVDAVATRDLPVTRFLFDMRICQVQRRHRVDDSDGRAAKVDRVVDRLAPLEVVTLPMGHVPRVE